jgi:hypothetical protein
MDALKQLSQAGLEHMRKGGRTEPNSANSIMWAALMRRIAQMNRDVADEATETAKALMRKRPWWRRPRYL